MPADDEPPRPRATTQLTPGDRAMVAVVFWLGTAMLVAQALVVMRGTTSPWLGLIGAVCWGGVAYVHANGGTVVR